MLNKKNNNMTSLTSRAKCSEVETVGSNIREIWENRGVKTDSYLSVHMGKADELTSMLVVKLNEVKGDTAANEDDLMRDMDNRALFYCIKAKTYVRSEDIRDSAIVLKDILDRYGLDIVHRSLNDQTTLTRAMISDFRSDEIKGHVDNIPEVSALVDNLEETNNMVSSRMLEVIDIKEANVNEKPASVLSKELKDIINKVIMPYLSAMAGANPELYESFNNDITAVIKDMNNKVRDRFNRK